MAQIAAPEPIVGIRRCRAMRIREENRNMFLLAAVTLCCGVLAGTFALLEPVLGQDKDNKDRPVAASAMIDAGAQTPVRVVGAPFEPNVNPRER